MAALSLPSSRTTQTQTPRKSESSRCGPRNRFLRYSLDFLRYSLDCCDGKNDHPSPLPLVLLRTWQHQRLQRRATRRHSLLLPRPHALLTRPLARSPRRSHYSVRPHHGRERASTGHPRVSSMKVPSARASTVLSALGYPPEG